MDHFHILDAYRSNKKLVPPNGTDAPESDVRKAVALTVEKYDVLTAHVRAHQRAHLLVQVMIGCTGLLFVVSTWQTAYSSGVKIAYTVIISTVFLIIAVFAYLFFFENRLYIARRTLRTYEELYLFSDNRKLYNLERSIREADADAEDEVPDMATTADAAERTLLTNALKGDDPVLMKAIQHGVLYTLRGDAGSIIDDSVDSLRKLIGTDTYRTVGEEDAYDIIDDIIVPMMIKSRNEVTVRNNGHFGTSSTEVCDTFCAETVQRLKEDVLDSKKTPLLGLLDEAWEKCHTQMSAVCGSDSLMTGENRCAFGCAKAENKQVSVSTVEVKNKIPDANWKMFNKVATEEAVENKNIVEVLENFRVDIPTEAECFREATGSAGVDAAYYGKKEDSGGDACYLHYRSEPKGQFSQGVGAFSGKLLFKEDHNVEVPEGTPAAVAAQIALHVKEAGTKFDISDYDVHLYDQLRAKDDSFTARKGFYEKTSIYLVNMLKPDITDDQDYLIPSMQRTNEELSGMTARQFQSRIVWPLTKASVFVHIRAVRLELQEHYAPATKQVRLQSRYNLVMAICGIGIVCTISGYFAFVVEIASAKTLNGSLTVRELVVDRWHLHVVSFSLMITFWTIAQSLLFRDHAKRVFNEKMKLGNTEAFINRVNELRDFLFEFSGTLPELRADDNTSTKLPAREKLMKAVHTEQMDIIGKFPDDDALMIDVFDMKNKLKFVHLAGEIVKAYDRCNKIGTAHLVPFPTPEVLMYVTSIIILCLLMSFLFSTFDIPSVARRVERVRSLRPRLYIGDEAAAREVAGLLQCAESSAKNQFELTKRVFYAAIGVVGIMITTLLVSGDEEYKMSLNGGFMLSRGRCLT